MPVLLVALILLATTPIGVPIATRTIVVRGVVKSAATGQPIQGANVYISPKAHTPTGADGSYALGVAVEDKDKTVTVRARAIGYEMATQSARITGDTITADFALKPAVNRLEEIVVTAAPADSRRASIGNS